MLSEAEIVEAYEAQQAWVVPFLERVERTLANRLRNRDIPDVFKWVMTHRYGISKAKGEEPTADRPYSHTALDARYSRVYGKLSITDDKREEFYQEIQQSIRNGQLLFIDERTDPGAITPLVIDVDLKLDVVWFARLTHRQLIPLAGFVQYIVTRLFFKDQETCDCIVIARDAMLSRSKDGKGWYLKCGIHLHWPDVFLGPTERLQLYHYVVRWFTTWSPTGTFPIVAEGQEQDTFSFDEFRRVCLNSAPSEQALNVARAQNPWTDVFDEAIIKDPHARLPYAYKIDPKDKKEQCKCRDYKDCTHVNHTSSAFSYMYVTTLNWEGYEVDPGYTTAGMIDIARVLSVISLRRKPYAMRATKVALTEQELADISRFANRDRDPREAPQLNSENDWSTDEKQLKRIRADSSQGQLIMKFVEQYFGDEIDTNSLRFGSIKRSPTYMARLKSTYCFNVAGGMHRTNGSYIRITRTQFIRRCFSLADEQRSTVGLACCKYQTVMDMPIRMVPYLFSGTNHTTLSRSKTYTAPPDLVPDTYFFNNIPTFCRDALNRQLARLARPVNASQKEYLLLVNGDRVPVAGAAGGSGADDGLGDEPEGPSQSQSQVVSGPSRLSQQSQPFQSQSQTRAKAKHPRSIVIEPDDDNARPETSQRSRHSQHSP